VTDYVRRVPDNVVNLKPAEVVSPDPAMAMMQSVLDKLESIETRIASMEEKIAGTEKVVGMVYENVKPTLDMLTNGPIGQLLGIAPPPAPRERRRLR
jgi:hypothetical protein